MAPRTLVTATFACALALAPLGSAAPRIETRILLAPASFLGVGVIDVSETAAREIGLVTPHGVEISSVAEDGPADQAGLQPGDIVLTFREDRVLGYAHFARLVRETPAGHQVDLGIVRDGDRQSVQVVIGQRSVRDSVLETFDAFRERFGEALKGELNVPRVRMNASNRQLGVEMERLEGQLAEYFGVGRGVLVRSVNQGSAAADAGLRAGDVIVEVNGKAVYDGNGVDRAMSEADARNVLFEIVRDRERTSLQVETRPQAPVVVVEPVSEPN